MLRSKLGAELSAAAGVQYQLQQRSKQLL